MNLENQTALITGSRRISRFNQPFQSAWLEWPHALLTAMSASFAETVSLVCPASCDCHSASDGARRNRWGAGSLLVGPCRRNNSAAAASIAPIWLRAHKSQRSRAAWRSAQVTVFEAANAGSVGTESSAGGASL